MKRIFYHWMEENTKFDTVVFDFGTGIPSIAAFLEECSSNKMLTSLEIRACTKLKELYCYNTDMENLNLTGLGKLEVLNCSKNN